MHDTTAGRSWPKAAIRDMAPQPPRTAALEATTAKSAYRISAPPPLQFGKGSVFGTARILTFLDLAMLLPSDPVASISVYVRFRPARLNRHEKALTFLVLSDAARASPPSS